jgi:hypothetical protein
LSGAGGITPGIYGSDFESIRTAPASNHPAKRRNAPRANINHGTNNPTMPPAQPRINATGPKQADQPALLCQAPQRSPREYQPHHQQPNHTTNNPTTPPTTQPHHQQLCQTTTNPTTPAPA